MSWHRLAGTLTMVGLFAGCASSQKNASADAAPARPVLRLEVAAPKPLDKLLGTYLNLARVNLQAPGETLNEGELERLVAQAPAQARSLLETEGYFNATVETETVPGDPPLVRVKVQPGPQTLVGQTQLVLQGPVVADAQRGEPQAVAARRALSEDWSLPTGDPFRNAEWGRAKSLSLARQRAQGYGSADWSSTQAQVDVNTNRASLSGTLESGPLYRAGPLQVEGLLHHDAQTVRNIANYQPGIPATEEFLLDFQERLQKTGLFDRTTVTLAQDPPDPESTSVNVQLTERQLQELTLGAGISANVGPQVNAEHVHRRPFGQALTLRNKFNMAQLEQSWEGEVSTHTLPGLYRNLLGGSARRVESDTDVVTSARLRVGRAQETRNISRLVFIEAEHSLTRSAAKDERASAVGVYYQGVWRAVDSHLLPTRGHVWTGQAGVGQTRSDPGGNGPFSRWYVKLDAYQPFGGWYGQARVELAQVFARGGVLAPESLRFRAGGDESVRGYKYRSLAPKENGVDVSGKVLFTASAEMARPIADSIPELWGAVFVDAGQAAQRWGDLKPALGYGVGLRYRSPVGPVKVDLAWGQEVRKLRLHLTVGVNF